MDQRTICLYLNRKRFSAQALHDKLVHVLGSDAVAYSTVSSYLRASRWMAHHEEQHSDASPDVIDKVILQALNQTPFTSVRELANPMCISRVIAWRCLTRSLGLIVQHLHSVPHLLTDAQRQIRIDQSNELVRLLESVQANDWQSFMISYCFGFICRRATKIFVFERVSNPMKG
jgi:hypothetical protein